LGWFFITTGDTEHYALILDNSQELESFQINRENSTKKWGLNPN